jgi:hypothetical protein
MEAIIQAATLPCPALAADHDWAAPKKMYIPRGKNSVKK